VGAASLARPPSPPGNRLIYITCIIERRRQHRAKIKPARIARLATPSAAAVYRRYVKSCASDFGSKSEDFSGYYDGLRGSQLGAISIHGPIATVAVTSRTGARRSATFVDAAGEWRVVIGIE